MGIQRRNVLAGGLALAALPAIGQGKQYGPGASDTEIKIGNTIPYSGPASAYGIIGRVEAAYFKMLNEQGGIGGRKINYISLDDGYSPPKAVEMIRRLVEQDEVLFTMSTLGTPSNSAIHKYMNQKKVPHLFLATGASKWNDPKNFPWTMGFNPNYESEGRLYGQDILRNRPTAKVAVLYQNDDYGKDYLKGFMEGLGEKGKGLVVKSVSYEVTDPTVDSQIVTLQSSGADTFFNITTPKFAAQAIRKVADIGWKPVHYLNQVSSSVGSVLKPAGLDKSVGLISMQYIKDPTEPRWASDAAMKDYFAFMKKYLPNEDPADGSATYAMAVSQLTVQLLKQCGNNLTRENVMKQAASIKGFQIPMALPGVLADTSAGDYALFQTMQLVKFDGKTWQGFGEPVAVR
ncbi:ABC transporter substrate-binding protein [Ramlibacter alkalitolerans]|uniref:ABC transporter substrate-binding protein n=1 Tax=Ramlibacter alkalitolerans TaxID=2039631 RepID=A0ABS1JHI8_9BURK|nr:ABC transporter substrate-binding protein [Ramlibacter alkalitolerans]MBL0423676.1 ABC transporter substrate-binding protein [Ramlibacter alkalitolerans]